MTKSIAGISDCDQSSEGMLEAYRALGDIDMALSVELDRRLISVQELLRLSVGDILVFSRAAGENIDLLVGDVLLGNAEILVVSERLAVRVADLQNKTAGSQNQAVKSKQANGASSGEVSGLTSNEN